MSYGDFIATLEAEWEPEAGFLWKARQGQFDAVGLERTLKKLQSLVIEESADVPRRLVSLLWYMPLFLHWQTDRVRRSGGNMNSYARAVASVSNEIERILGVP